MYYNIARSRNSVVSWIFSLDESDVLAYALDVGNIRSTEEVMAEVAAHESDYTRLVEAFRKRLEPYLSYIDEPYYPLRRAEYLAKCILSGGLAKGCFLFGKVAQTGTGDLIGMIVTQEYGYVTPEPVELAKSEGDSALKKTTLLMRLSKRLQDLCPGKVESIYMYGLPEQLYEGIKSLELPLPSKTLVNLIAVLPEWCETLARREFASEEDQRVQQILLDAKLFNPQTGHFDGLSW